MTPASAALGRALALLFVAIGLWVWRPGLAEAHASLLATEPPAGSVLDRSPGHMRLEFNEPVTPVTVRLVDAAGRAEDLQVAARDDAVDVVLPPDMPRGTQMLSYRIVSADGHPVGGTVVFSLGAKGAAAAVSESTPGLAAAIWLLRVTLFVCLFGGIGGAFFRALDEGPRVGRLDRGLLVVIVSGFAALMLSLGLQGLDVLGQAWPDLFSDKPWRAAAATSYGAMAALSALALLGAGASLLTNRPGWRCGFACIGMAALGLGFAATGHASTAPPQALMRPAVFLHVVGAAFWGGALVPLLASLGGEPPDRARIVGRFSRIATVVVPTMVLIGVGIAAVQVESPSSLLTTSYGRLLCAKLVLAGALLALGAANRTWLAPKLGIVTDRWTRLFHRSIASEIILMVLLAGVVAGWRFTPPPRSLVAVAPLTLHMHQGSLMVMATLSPGRVGSNDMALDVLGPDFGPVELKQLDVSLAPGDGSLEPRLFQARKIEPGHWQVDDFYVPFPGVWRLEVGALVDDFDRVDLSAEQGFPN